MKRRFVRQIALLFFLLLIIVMSPVCCFAEQIGVELLWKFPDSKWLQVEIEEGVYRFTFENQDITLDPGNGIKLGQNGFVPFMIWDNTLQALNGRVLELQPLQQTASFRVREPGKDWLSYRGSVKIEYKNRSWSLTNYIEAEDYLKGVVPIEMSNYWAPEGMEALKAQAVAARTYLYRNLNQTGIITDSPNRHQAYMGKTIEGSASKAVEHTKGEILVDINTEKPIDALYSSHNGGYTESTENVWSGHDLHYSSHPDPFTKGIGGCVDTWRFLISAERLGKAFGLTTVRDIQLHKYVSGRVYKIKLVDWLGEEAIVSGSDFLKRFYPYEGGVNCYSLLGKLFDVKTIFLQDKKNNQEYTYLLKENSIIPSGEKQQEGPLITKADNPYKNKQDSQLFYLFEGSGWGHGVGMSQWGAYNMASQGFSYKDILFFYYENVKLIKKSK